MKSRTTVSISTLFSAFAALAPITTHADSAMDACIKAFVDERVPKDRTIKIRKVEKSNAWLTAPHAERISLTASGAKSGMRIAAATCVVSPRGDSIELYDSEAPSKLASAAPVNAGA